MRQLKVALAFCATLVVTGCASPGTPFGKARCPILVADAQIATIEHLECAARGGNKLAQFALSQRYASGVGAARDLKRALTYLRAAASDVPNITYIYSPAVGAETYGRSIAVSNGIIESGLVEAQYALAMAYAHGDGVTASPNKARVWLARAAAKGYEPAVAAIQSQRPQ